MSDYLFDKSGTDDEVADLERILGVYAHRAPLRRPRRPLIVGVVGIGVALVAAAVLALVLTRSAGPAASPCVGGAKARGLSFTSTQGAARCGGQVAASGIVPVGTWLETGASDRAHVVVASIGELSVEPSTRVRVVETSTTSQRLELAAGRISARVTAPPRLFVVDTPAAAAVDLGCAYELSVDGQGRTHLVVTSGSVSLEGPRGAVLVLHGTEVTAVRGEAAGLPIALDTSPEVRTAAGRFERGETAAVAQIVSHATDVDIVTLFSLIVRVDGAERAAVVDRLEELVPLPFDYHREDMLAARPEALDAWREEVEWQWLLR